MPDGWEDLYGFNKFDPSDAPLDADSDGEINLDEYLAGTNPRLASSVFGIIDIQQAGSDWEISFSAVQTKLYQLHFTPDLSMSTQWNLLLDDVPGTNGVIQVVDPTGTNDVQRFYRIRIKQ
jgi:hypothetical protein